MRLPRFTTRRLMALVAVVGIGLETARMIRKAGSQQEEDENRRDLPEE